MTTPSPSPYQPKRVLRLGPLQPAAPGPSPEAEQVSRSIDNIIKQTRQPFGETRPLDQNQVAELEAALRDLESQLLAREESIRALEFKLAERERDFAETEALLQAREAILTAERQRARAPAAAPSTGPTAGEKQAYEKFRAELDAQEATLKEAKAQLRERGQFLEDAESSLLAKLAAQQEKETALERREDDLRSRETLLRQQAGQPPLATAPAPVEKA